MNFIMYDLAFLALFIIFIGIFLYKNKKNLGYESGLILYRTQWGVKLIDYVGGKYKKTLKALSYVSIGTGYILMASMLYLIVQTVYLYLTTPISQVIKAPPVMPLIPYFPKIFGLESFFPPFYFIYFILALIIVATVHEFAHGIFARRYGVKIKSTGFAFLKYFPAVTGAFVEQDEKDMDKRSKFEQMSILSAGVFSNIIVTLLFFFILVLVFSTSFAPSGVMFTDYAYSIVGITSISAVNGFEVNSSSLDNVLERMEENELNQIEANGEYYVGIKDFNENYIALYNSAPAIKANLGGAIMAINNIDTKNKESLSEELSKYRIGQEVTIKTTNGKEILETKVILEKHPEKDAPWLGIGFVDRTNNKKITAKIFKAFSSFKDPDVYYKPSGEFATFMYDLVWWILIINLLVALFNMLPLGFLDGGRFFYLTFLGITGSKKNSERAFSAMTYFLLFLLLLLMVKWALSFF